MLFGSQQDLLLTERAHDMRSHPGQVSFPGGAIDPGETPRRRRAARGVRGDRAAARRRRGLRRAARAVAAAEQLRGHAGARLVGAREPGRRRRPGRGPRRLPRAAGRPARARPPGLGPPPQRLGRARGSWSGPTTTSSCGASRPGSSPGSSTSSAGRAPGTSAGCVTCPPTCCKVDPARRRPRPPYRRSRRERTRLGADPRRAALRHLGLLAGLHHRCLRHRRAADRRASSGSGWRPPRSATPRRRSWSRSRPSSS